MQRDSASLLLTIQAGVDEHVVFVARRHADGRASGRVRARVASSAPGQRARGAGREVTSPRPGAPDCLRHWQHCALHARATLRAGKAPSCRLDVELGMISPKMKKAGSVKCVWPEILRSRGPQRRLRFALRAVTRAGPRSPPASHPARPHSRSAPLLEPVERAGVPTSMSAEQEVRRRPTVARGYLRAHQALSAERPLARSAHARGSPARLEARPGAMALHDSRSRRRSSSRSSAIRSASSRSRLTPRRA